MAKEEDKAEVETEALPEVPEVETVEVEEPEAETPEGSGPKPPESAGELAAILTERTNQLRAVIAGSDLPDDFYTLVSLGVLFGTLMNSTGKTPEQCMAWIKAGYGGTWTWAN